MFLAAFRLVMFVGSSRVESSSNGAALFVAPMSCDVRLAGDSLQAISTPLRAQCAKAVSVCCTVLPVYCDKSMQEWISLL